MSRVFTAQIDTTTNRVVATNESDTGLGAPPAGRQFVVYDPAAVGDPIGKYYVAGAFQVAAP